VLQMIIRLCRVLAKASTVVVVVLAFGLHIHMAAAAGPALADYRITAGDVLEFDFLDDQELPRQVTVGGSGHVQIPLLGAIAVAGATIGEAHGIVRDAFIARQLLVDPDFSLAIVSYRPVFVLGDVKTPGSYTFQSQLTVEQAIGLAGGLLAVQSSAEDRIFLRVRLEGDIRTLESEIAREATWMARLAAQLDGRKSVDTTDMPKEAEPFLKKDLVDHFVAIENRILEAELTAYKSQASILSSNISETTKQLALFDQLRDNQEQAVRFTQEELERVLKLRKTGLNTAADVAAIQRQLNNDEGRLLQILADAAGAQRQIAALKQQLAALEDNRIKDALIQLQERQSLLVQHYARYRSYEEQLALVANWATAEADSNLKSVISYTIRQRAGESSGDQAATAATALLPGDVVIVSLLRPDPALAIEGQAGTSSTN